MTDTPDPAAIAASLGKRERDALHRAENYRADGWMMPKAFARLSEYKLVRYSWGLAGAGEYTLTPLGRAVAAAIGERDK